MGNLKRDDSLGFLCSESMQNSEEHGTELRGQLISYKYPMKVVVV